MPDDSAADDWSSSEPPGAVLGIGEFTQGGLQFERLTVTPHAHFRLRTRWDRSNHPWQVVQPADFAAVERQDHVALLQAGLCAGAVGSNNCDKRSVVALQSETCGNRRRNLLDLHAEPTALDFAVFLELCDDVFSDI